VAIHGECGTDVIQFQSQMQGDRWTSKDEFFRTLMTIVHVQAPHMFEQKKYLRVRSFCLSDAVPLLLATTLTSFGVGLQQDPKCKEQRNKLYFAIHQLGAKAGVKLLADSFERACQGDDNNEKEPKARFVAISFKYADMAHAEAQKGLRYT
jgi:hypothetical protein